MGDETEREETKEEEVKMPRKKSTKREERAARKKKYDEHPITKRMRSLYKRNKASVVRIADSKSRVDMSHLKSEPKGVIISMILESEYGNRRLETWRALLK